MEASHRTKGLVRLTMACNERCPFCNVPAEDYPTRPTPEEELEGALQDFLAAGERTLTISGGEPTLLRKRLVAYARRAREAGIEFLELQTNAVLIDADYARELAEAGITSAFVSLLSHVPEDHDHLAGLDGAFPRCVTGIDALLEADIPVTLNPVFASRTQDQPPAYVRFVAERFPGIRTLSMSAVQPHGRAKDGQLLPDYAVLGPAVREARRVAAQAGITLLNPYCGLPLCAGWEDADEGLVPLVEAGPGLDNRGNKSHGEPCQVCALRPACGGAWHAYWSLRGGSGLQAPVRSTPPWDGPPTTEGPTVWGHALGEQATDLAIAWNPNDKRVLRDIRRAIQEEPETRIALGIRVAGLDEARVLDLVRLASAIGVTRVGLLGGHADLARRLARLGGLPVEACP